MELTNMTNYLKNLALVSSIGIRVNDSNNTSESYIGPLINGLYPITDCKGNVITSTYASSTREKGIWAPFTKGPSLTTNQTGTGNMYYTYVGFGSGTTPVQASDTQLENMITSLTTVSNETSLSYTMDVNDDKTEITRVSTIKIAIKNTGTNSVVIGEVGFYQSMNTTNHTLLHREVLDNPVTVDAGAIATFEYVFEVKGGLS